MYRMSRKRPSAAVTLGTGTAPDCSSCAVRAAVADAVMSERALIRSMVKKHLGARRDDVHEVEELEQELWLHLWQRLSRSIRPQPLSRALIATMCRNFLRNLRRSARSQKRRPPMLLSLSWPSPAPRSPAEPIGDWASQRHLDARRGAHPAAEDGADWTMDLAGVEAGLPDHLRSLLRRLATMSVTEAARRMGIARSTGYRWRKLLRQRLQTLMHSDA
jgi:RNA polymerase sigma factor (sigma-70 family)